MEQNRLLILTKDDGYIKFPNDSATMFSDSTVLYNCILVIKEAQKASAKVIPIYVNVSEGL